MKSKDNGNEVLKSKSNVDKESNKFSKIRSNNLRKKRSRKKKKFKIILFLTVFSITVSIIYYQKKTNYLGMPNKEILSFVFEEKDEFLGDINNIKNSLDKLYITEEDKKNINEEVTKLEEDIKGKDKKEAKELINKLKSQINDISAKNQINLEEEYNKINDEIIDNYTEEEKAILNQFRDSYEDAYNNNDFLLAKSRLSEMETYIKDTNKLANERRISKTYEENSTVDPSTREPFYVNDILIVNKEYGLPSDFAPGESSEARQAFEEMKYQAQLEGIYLNAFSTYRSYWRQDRLYNNYVYEYGEEKADTFSARAGFSEHQTGLAFDIGGLDSSLWAQDDFRYTEEAKWLLENAYKYGFILRFPEGKEWITGYQYESWHFRYIGVENSINFKDNNLTLEEYLGLVKN